MTLDDIIVFSDSRKWFEQHRLMPSTWNLPDGEDIRIAGAGIGITICSPPANCMPLSKLPKESWDIHLITLDPSFFEDEVFTDRQQIAVLLHEIGHVVNPPTEESIDHDYTMALIKLSESEVFADDYAKHCGFGADFANALEIMIIQDPKRFDSDAINKRIELLREDRKPHLHPSISTNAENKRVQATGVPPTPDP